MTNFEAVSLFNEMIQNLPASSSNPKWDQLEAQFGLIQEELNEIQQAIQEKNYIELRDGIADVLVTTYGLAYRAGIDANEDMKIVHESNMSKFCKSTDEALRTKAKYEKIGVKVSYRNQANGMIAVVSLENQTGADGKKYPMGKLLKSVNYFEPQFN